MSRALQRPWRWLVSMDNRGTLASGVSVLSAWRLTAPHRRPPSRLCPSVSPPRVPLLKGLQFLEGTEEIPTPCLYSCFSTMTLTAPPSGVSQSGVCAPQLRTSSWGSLLPGQKPDPPGTGPGVVLQRTELRDGSQHGGRVWGFRTADRPVLSACGHPFISLFTAPAC